LSPVLYDELTGLIGVKTRLKDVQERILEIIGEDEPILVGHSLENDLNAIKLIHHRVIDTAVIFPHQQPPYKCSLKYLAKKHLSKIIQQVEVLVQCLSISKQCYRRVTIAVSMLRLPCLWLSLKSRMAQILEFRPRCAQAQFLCSVCFLPKAN
jgi:hypothetical protein